MAGTEERYEAAMLLSGVGDAMGYKDGEWEFSHSGQLIHAELEELGGVDSLVVTLPDWPVSDDTVMHLATGEAMVKCGQECDKEKLYSQIARAYKESMLDMGGRAPGMTCMSSSDRLRPSVSKGYMIPFNERGGGCGAAMRAMCIGLRYPKPEDLDELIAVGVESGRMTHHHPTGFLGSMAAALFTAYAIQDKPVREWGAGLMEVLPRALQYVESSKHCVEDNTKAWGYFTDAWKTYLELRQISDGNSDPVFPESFDVKARDEFYKSVSYCGWGGSSGHDAPMIAYDALLGSGHDWAELCSRSMFHSGDSDSTGVMAACWYGAIYGYSGVSPRNYHFLEYRDRLVKVAHSLYRLTHGQMQDEDSLSSNTDDVKQLAHWSSYINASNSQITSVADSQQTDAGDSQVISLSRSQHTDVEDSQTNSMEEGGSQHTDVGDSQMTSVSDSQQMDEGDLQDTCKGDSEQTILGDSRKRTLENPTNIQQTVEMNSGDMQETNEKNRKKLL